MYKKKSLVLPCKASAHTPSNQSPLVMTGILEKNRTHGSTVFEQMAGLSMCMVREGHIPEVLLPLRIER